MLHILALTLSFLCFLTFNQNLILNHYEFNGNLIVSQKKAEGAIKVTVLPKRNYSSTYSLKVDYVIT